jgi:hypothetical protein
VCSSDLATGTLPCGNTPATYEMRILSDGKLQIAATNDTCRMRVREFEGDYELNR